MSKFCPMRSHIFILICHLVKLQKWLTTLTTGGFWYLPLSSLFTELLLLLLLLLEAANGIDSDELLLLMLLQEDLGEKVGESHEGAQQEPLDL